MGLGGKALVTLVVDRTMPWYEVNCPSPRCDNICVEKLTFCQFHLFKTSKISTIDHFILPLNFVHSSRYKQQHFALSLVILFLFLSTSSLWALRTEQRNRRRHLHYR